MTLEDTLQSIIADVQVPLDHPEYHERIFSLVAKANASKLFEAKDIITNIFEEEYVDLSQRLDQSGIQESCSVRNILRSRQLALLLIDDKGEVLSSLLPGLIDNLQKHLFSLGPDRQYDAKRNEHILYVLQKLNNNKEVIRLIKKVTKPLYQKNAEELIRETLQLPQTTAITDAHTRQAALSAWLCTLRQNVGSCFATAPAEIIHDEQPEQFLQDVTDLISSGQLKRTIEGIEYTMPLSASWGNGDLKKPILIKCFTDSIEPPLWLSPGLFGALETIGLIPKDAAENEKTSALKNLILNQITTERPYEVITTETLLRRILMAGLQLTEKNLEDYESRPHEKFQMQLIAPQIVTSKSKGTISDRCAAFFQQFALAKNVFKSFTDNALLKSWEFTLASFAETKHEFTKWNLYYSLGLATQEPGGIGECIYQHLKHKLDLANRKLESTQAEYEAVHHYIKSTEARIRQASTEQELNWLKIEYQSRLNEFHSLESIRDKAHSIAKGLVELHNELHKIYLELFKNYFQEVYDADTQEVTTGPFDDCPAGFRLLYKYGRANTSQWTLIRTPGEFIDALTNFFSATEAQVIALLDHGPIEREISEVITAIIHHVKTKVFIETAFDRMAAAYRVAPIKNPLENLDKIEKKPWAYTSGGTMNNLVQTYYRLPDRPKDEGRWVESEVELLVFLVDTLKQMPPNLIKPYLEGRREAMLIQSPTHAFLLKPNNTLLQSAFQSEAYTYTYLRDQLFRPAEGFIDSMALDDAMIQFLIAKLAERVHVNFRPRFKDLFRYLSGPLNPVLFRAQVSSALEMDRGLRMAGRSPLLNDELDSFLYSSLPLMPTPEIRGHLKDIFSMLPHITQERIDSMIQLFDQMNITRGERFIDADQFQHICLSLLCLSGLQTSSEVDYPLLISTAAQKLGLAMPAPIFFADTNWVKDEFAFIINPGTGSLELWRIDYTGRVGAPMSMWKEWVDGSRPDIKWGVYVKPYEYGQS